MLRLKRVAVCTAVLAVFVFSAPIRAAATGSWPRPVDGAVALEYGRTWVDSRSRTCTHGGLDLRAPAGALVRACAGGEVVFAGLVPAGEGQRAYAVTVLVAGDLRVTYLPLASVSVSRGQDLPEGALVGAVAADGDGSSSVSHIHLGVKRGSAALDPATFLKPAGATPLPTPPAPMPSPAPRPVAPDHLPGRAPVPGFAPVPQPGYAPAPASSASIADALRVATQGAAATLALVSPLARVERVAEPAVFDLDRAEADLAAGRESALAIGVRVGLVLLAGACVLPVLRAARKAAAQAAPVPVPRDRS